MAIAGASVMQQLARLRPGDNEINHGSARYLMRRGTYSVQKAPRELGWESRIGVEEGIRLTLEWLR